MPIDFSFSTRFIACLLASDAKDELAEYGDQPSTALRW
jgi:hypothetical protein